MRLAPPRRSRPSSAGSPSPRRRLQRWPRRRFGHRYDHWFDGDGMMQAFTFGEAGVSHRARILETPKRRRETRAGRRLLPAFATLPPDGRTAHGARRHEQCQHLGARPWRTADGALGGGLGARRRSGVAGGGRVRRLAVGPRGRALLGPSQGRGRRHLLEHRLCHRAPADAALLQDRPLGPARGLQRLARGAAWHGARLCGDQAPPGARDFVLRGGAGALRRRPDQLSGRPRLASRARHPRDRGGQGRAHPGPPLRACAGLLLPPRQRLGGGGRHHPPRSLPGGGPDVRNPRLPLGHGGRLELPLYPSAAWRSGPMGPPRSSR